MEDKKILIETLYERASDYGKTSFELIKLQVIDKTSDIVSSIIPQTIVFVLFASFMIFLNLGLAFWLGEILGEFYYGFFTVAAFYVVIAFILYFFMRKWLKRVFYDYFIRQLLK